MSLCRTLPWLWRHPLTRARPLAASGRYLAWQLRCRLKPAPRAMAWVNHSRLWLAPGLTGATGNLYCGLHEWPDMAFVLHLLRPEDTFADIGANVGSYTVLASAVVGCRTEAFEPVPASHAWLRRQLVLNGIEERVRAHRAALGADHGRLLFSLDTGPMNRVVDAAYAGVSRPVPVLPIDSVSELGRACCWKLDVEGHEQAVLAGAAATLAQAPPAAILCEDRSAPVAGCLSAAGFQPCAYDPWSRSLSPDSSAAGGNQLWVSERDLAWVRERLRGAPVFRVLGRRI